MIFEFVKGNGYMRVMNWISVALLGLALCGLFPMWLAVVVIWGWALVLLWIVWRKAHEE